MNLNYPTNDAPATPEYVLAVLQDMHRQACQFDPEVDSDATLSFETTVAEWRKACDLVGSRELGRAHNEMWGMNCSDAEWKGVLEPASQRHLSDVCQLIARRTIHRIIRAANIFGRECAPAGAFLTIRSLLQQAGVPAANIAPSTPLAPFTRRYSPVFLGPISRLAPGTLPPVRFRTPVYDAAIWGIFAATILFLAGGIATALFDQGYLFTIAGVLLFAFCYALSWFSARHVLPASVQFGDLKTFRDLAVVLARASESKTNADPW